MAPPPLYVQSVPVLLRYLGALHRVLQAVDALPAGEASEVLTSRIAPGMLDFAEQIETACFLALRAAFPLASSPVPAFGIEPRTNKGLRARVTRTEALLNSLSPKQFSTPPALVHEKAGAAHIELPPQEFLMQFALPNFFFHVSLSYAIARSRNVSLSKAHFDGFHNYAGAA
jgi:uncharacterized protein